MTLHLWPEQIPLIDVPAELQAPARGSLAMPAGPQPAVGEDGQLHPAVTSPLPTIEGGWAVLMADPAWNFRSWVANANPESNRSAERHYRTMKLDEIKAMPIREIAAKDAHLFLWTTGPFLMEAKDVMRAWGFKYSSTAFVWMKLKRSVGGQQLQMISLAEIEQYLHFGMGHTTRKNVEFCLLGRRGSPRRIAKNVPEAILAPVREHSRKPDEAFERAMLYAEGPYLELFSREERDGWTTWGNETGKF